MEIWSKLLMLGTHFRDYGESGLFIYNPSCAIKLASTMVVIYEAGWESEICIFLGVFDDNANVIVEFAFEDEEYEEAMYPHSFNEEYKEPMDPYFLTRTFREEWLPDFIIRTMSWLMNLCGLILVMVRCDIEYNISNVNLVRLAYKGIKGFTLCLDDDADDDDDEQASSSTYSYHLDLPFPPHARSAPRLILES
ncbi:hypothetical protein VNO80_13522 [Phaseolus coccineus]|uniref:Uncharacterized protein n=1 Tax=Phaseolus coccineus TaxID=3886 RepID=A0AAN9N147_PHACN